MNGKHVMEWVGDSEWQLEEYLEGINGALRRITGVENEEESDHDSVDTES